MEKMDKSEKYLATGYALLSFGMMVCASAIGSARAYGYHVGDLICFTIGAVSLIAATVMLYISSMLRDRRIKAEFERRRIARERRRAERERRGW